MLQSRQVYKKNRGCVDVGRTTTFCMTRTRFMSHNLVVQSCMTKLLSTWTHLYPCALSPHRVVFLIIVRF